MRKRTIPSLQSGNEAPSEEGLIRQVLLHPRKEEPLVELATFYESQGDPRAELVHDGRKWAQTGCKKALKTLQDKAGWPEGELLKRILPPPYGVNSEWGAKCPPKLAPEDGAVTQVRLYEFEQMIGMTVPVDVRAFWSNYGGGIVEPASFRIPGVIDQPACYETLKRFYCMTNPGSGTDELTENWQLLQECRKSNMGWRRRPRCNFFPIGYTGPYLGWPHWICVEGGDFRFGNVYEIAAFSPDACHKVADTLGEFLAMLTDYAPDCVALITAGDLVRPQWWLNSTGEDTEERERRIKVIQHAATHCSNGVIAALLAKRAKDGARIRESEPCDCQEVVDLLRSAVAGAKRSRQEA